MATGDMLGVGMARLGQPTQKIVFGTLDQLKTVDFGAPLHCFSLVGDAHPLGTSTVGLGIFISILVVS